MILWQPWRTCMLLISVKICRSVACNWCGMHWKSLLASSGFSSCWLRNSASSICTCSSCLLNLIHMHFMTIRLHSLSISFQPACSLLLLSVCSTTIEMESIGSSGRSTPALLNGQSSARSSATKTMAYTCCWDRCPQCFNSSPDLAEHIRGIHVDGQRGGVCRL